MRAILLAAVALLLSGCSATSRVSSYLDGMSQIMEDERASADQRLDRVRAQLHRSLPGAIAAMAEVLAELDQLEGHARNVRREEILGDLARADRRFRGAGDALFDKLLKTPGGEGRLDALEPLLVLHRQVAALYESLKARRPR